MIEWYFQDSNGDRIGPISEDEFQAHILNGTISATTRIWRTGFADWMLLEKLIQNQPPEQVPAAPISSRGDDTPKFAQCSTCNERWPENLLKQYGRTLVCGNCVRSDRDKKKRAEMSKAVGVGSSWGPWLAKCAVVGLVMAALIILRGYMRAKVYEMEAKESQNAINEVVKTLGDGQ